MYLGGLCVVVLRLLLLRRVLATRGTLRSSRHSVQPSFLLRRKSNNLPCIVSKKNALLYRYKKSLKNGLRDMRTP